MYYDELLRITFELEFKGLGAVYLICLDLGGRLKEWEKKLGV